jgi:hypothetical protein
MVLTSIHFVQKTNCTNQVNLLLRNKKIENMKKLYIIILLATCTINDLYMYAQTTHTNNSRTGTDFLGFNSGSTGPLDIRNDFNDVINFKTNTNLQATLDALGNFSIGLNLGSYFGIANTPVLWHNGDISSIFVGVNAGINNSSGNTLFNTLIGNGAGKTLTVSHKNTFIGYQSGFSTVTSSNNTDDGAEDPGNVAIGFQALYNNVDQVTQTAIGYKAEQHYSFTE